MIVWKCTIWEKNLSSGVDYNEVGNEGEISDSIQFLETVGDLNMSDINFFKDFKETLEFVIRGEY